MSRAPDHDPADRRPPTNWSRVAMGLVAMAVGLLIIYLALRGF